MNVRLEAMIIEK